LAKILAYKRLIIELTVTQWTMFIASYGIYNYWGNANSIEK